MQAILRRSLKLTLAAAIALVPTYLPVYAQSSGQDQSPAPAQQPTTQQPATDASKPDASKPDTAKQDPQQTDKDKQKQDQQKKDQPVRANVPSGLDEPFKIARDRGTNARTQRL